MRTCRGRGVPFVFRENTVGIREILARPHIPKGSASFRVVKRAVHNRQEIDFEQALITDNHPMLDFQQFTGKKVL
jgi:hypothetical protein